jgi:hypothetical protein
MQTVVESCSVISASPLIVFPKKLTWNIACWNCEQCVDSSDLGCWPDETCFSQRATGENNATCYTWNAIHSAAGKINTCSDTALSSIRIANPEVCQMRGKLPLSGESVCSSYQTIDRYTSSFRDTRNAWSICVGKHEGEGSLARHRHVHLEERIILKLILRKYGMKVELNSPGLG